MSGRSSCAGTPVAASMAWAYSAGTPRLVRSIQCHRVDWDIPSAFASRTCPPAASTARFNAMFVAITDIYRRFGLIATALSVETIGYYFGIDRV